MMKQTEINLKKSRNEPASKAISEILKEFPDAPTRMLAGMLMIGLIGFGGDMILRSIEARFMRWRAVMVVSS